MSRLTLPNPLIDEPAGAKAIEVAALLGDSVIDVKHCIDPNGGKVTRTTVAVIAAACVLAVMSAVAFAVSVHVAAVNHAALDTWTHVLKRPAYSFRPETLGFAYDWCAFGGFALALVAAAAGIARWRAEKRSPFYRIGTAPGVELALDGAPAAAFPLVAPSPSGDDFVMTYAAGIDGDLSLDGTTTSLAELATHGKPSARTAGAVELAIPANARIRARSGNATFVITAMPRPRRHAAPLLANIERRTMMYVAGSLAAHLVVLGALAQLQEGDGTATIEIDGHELTDISSTSIEREQPTPPDKTADGETAGGGDQGATALDPSMGRAGRPDSTQQGAMKIAGEQAAPHMTRQEAIDAASTTDIAGRVHASDFANLVAAADIQTGFDNLTVYGADREGTGTSYGSFGWGRSGFGTGCGGCDGDGTIGSGRYGTIGSGPGTGVGPGGDGHLMRDRKHVAEVPRPVIGEPEGIGDGREIVRRYINRNIDKIKYCYEKELLAKPTLAGTVTVQFFLAETGGVTGSVGSGFDATVASCVADVVANIQFPRMPGSATVHYPFTFRAPH
ncbi:MAG TPA: AgmX/PglI C-terminal domain-containing protein [Kofleriaceae bacterium]|jgi:hypothetical protein|nr:AgmX/PglI C-terminal domain-containing protein [Kofleriaceae bacterium]